jgi:hypothetical protein
LTISSLRGSSERTTEAIISQNKIMAFRLPRFASQSSQ